jgi:hypothetical protein
VVRGSADEDRTVALAVGRVLRCDARGQGRQLVAGASELGQHGLNFTRALGDQAGHVDAGRLAAVTDVKDLPDLLEGEPGYPSIPLFVQGRNSACLLGKYR